MLVYNCSEFQRYQSLLSFTNLKRKIRHSKLDKRTTLRPMERELLALRAKNARLMKSNLSALMAVREAEADVDDLLAALRDQCAVLERAGLAVPERCREMLAAAARVEEDAEVGGGHHVENDSSAADTEHQSSASGVDAESTDEL